MEKGSFDRFIELITFDQSLYQTERAVNELQTEIDRLTASLDRLNQTLDFGRDRVRQLRKDVDIRELEMKELDEKEKKARTRLDASTNQKEYQLAKDEVAALKKKQHDYEDTLVKVWSIFETAQKEFTKTEEEIVQKKTVLEAELKEKQIKITEFKNVLSQSDKERRGKETDIPDEWLQKYGRMRNSVSNPVVAVTSESCSACFYKIPDQDLLLIKRQELIQCKGCYRFLYGSDQQDEKVKTEEASGE